MKQLPEILTRLYQIVSDLETMFPGRPFTPDGHMIGSIGEALASYYYGVSLHTPSHQGHDGLVRDKNVEVKLTQGKRVALRSEPRHLLVLKLNADGTFEEVYNGDGKRVWQALDTTKTPSNGQFQISLKRLRELMKTVSPIECLPRTVLTNDSTCAV